MLLDRRGARAATVAGERSLRRPAPRRALSGDEYHYYPTHWVSPYIDRRRKIGWDLYALLGIGKTDKARMHARRAATAVLRCSGRHRCSPSIRDLQTGSWPADFGVFTAERGARCRNFGSGHLPARRCGRRFSARRAPMSWNFRPTRCWSAGWRWAMPMTRRSKIRSSRSAGGRGFYTIRGVKERAGRGGGRRKRSEQQRAGEHG